MASLSIARRLFLSAAIWSGTVLLIAGLSLSALYRRTAEQAFDERLNVYLRELVADLAAPGETEKPEIGNLGEPRFEVQGSGWYWQILRVDDPQRVIKTSQSLYGTLLPHLNPADAGKVPGQRLQGYVTGPDDRTLRLVERRIELADEGRYLVTVAAETDEFDADIKEFQWTLGITLLFLFAALVGTTALQVRYGLRPLKDLRRAIGTVREGKAERIEGQYPVDIAPLAGELNQLIAANHDILERARTQVGNLAHALKTPLSVIANEAETATGVLAQKVHEQVEVMRHQVDFTLNRARAAALAGALGTSTEVGSVVEGLIRTFAKIYRDREIGFDADITPGLRFRGERQDLEEMVGNLIDNAGKWAKDRVVVGAAPVTEASRPTIRIVIDDDGPGVPEDRRAEMLARGRRLDETKPGSGLGLSIVADLAASYQGQFDLSDSPAGGLRATLILPGI